MRRADLIIKNVHILTMDENFTEYPNGAIAIKNGKIAAIGEGILEKYTGNVIDGKGKIAIPGMINTHTHAAMTLLRGYGSDNPLRIWLENYIWPAEEKCISYEFVKDGTDLACYEMLRNGITTFVDMYFYEDAVAQSVHQAKMRAVICTGILDFPNPGARTPEEGLEKTKACIQAYKSDEHIFPCVGPHAPYTCAPATLIKAMEIAEEYDTLFHIHIAETEFEVKQMKKLYENTPVKHLNDIGVLNERVLAAHMVYPTEEEIELLAEKGVKVAHCPESNLKLASGIAPVVEMMKKGVTVGLGTDGAASNDDLDLIGEMRTAALIHKGYRRDATVLSAKEALAMATREGAKAVRLDDKIGTLEKGKYADLVLINVNEPHVQPLYDPYTQIVYSGKNFDVDTVIIGGEIVVKNKRVITIDKECVLNKAQEWKERVKKLK